MQYGLKDDFIESSKGQLKEQDIFENKIMVPVDDEGNALCTEMISHALNSHTLKPSIVHGPDYPEQFEGLKGTYLIDFPGMFDTSGSEIGVVIDLALKMIVQ